MGKLKFSITTLGSLTACASASLALMTACAVPGMRLNVTASGNDEPLFALPGQDAPGVDVFAINRDTIQRLNDERPPVVIPVAKPADRVASKPEEYKLGPQDVVRVTVWDHPELNNPTGTTTGETVGRVIAADGTMFYPYVGTIHVAGKTTQDVQKYITTSLGRVVREPQVEVSVQTYHSQRVFIAGAVKTPGVQYLTDAPTNIAELLAMAGGPEQEADLKHVSVTRNGNAAVYDLYDELVTGNFSGEPFLQPGDVVTVPDGRSNKIFVLGEIPKQGSLPFPPGKYSLTDALGDAGGVVQITSNPAQVYVIRFEGDHPTIYHLNAKNPDALVIADGFELHSRDVIYVEAAEVARIGRIISQILPAATVAVYGRTLTQ